LTLGDSLKERARIVLAASEGLNNRQIVKVHGLEEHRVSQWWTRWHEFHEHWKRLDAALRPKMSAKLIRKWLADAKGRGKKPTIGNANENDCPGNNDQSQEHDNEPVMLKLEPFHPFHGPHHGSRTKPSENHQYDSNHRNTVHNRHRLRGKMCLRFLGSVSIIVIGQVSAIAGQ